MRRTQIQLPDPLYDEARRVAALQDWSLAELVRRGVEYIVGCYPVSKDAGGWAPPEPRRLGAFRAPVEEWRERAYDDAKP